MSQALHTNSCSYLAKVKVIKEVCKAKLMHCLFVFNYAANVTLFRKIQTKSDVFFLKTSFFLSAVPEFLGRDTHVALEVFPKE